MQKSLFLYLAILNSNSLFKSSSQQKEITNNSVGFLNGSSRTRLCCFSYILQYIKEVKIHLSQQKSLRPKSQSIHHSVMATTTVVNVKWINQLVYRHNNASNDQRLPPVKCETWFVKSLITALDLLPVCSESEHDYIKRYFLLWSKGLVEPHSENIL